MVSYLRDSFNTGLRIQFDISVDEIQMDVSEAIPLGLILNEARYSSVCLETVEPNCCTLVISDNGVGIPMHLRSEQNNSLGMSLMQGLSEDLEGILTIECNK